MMHILRERIREMRIIRQSIVVEISRIGIVKDRPSSRDFLPRRSCGNGQLDERRTRILEGWQWAGEGSGERAAIRRHPQV